MTIPAHATITAGATIIFTDDIRVIVISVILGIFPDLIRLIDKNNWSGYYFWILVTVLGLAYCIVGFYFTKLLLS